uniref:Ionotropic glutamate receptor L-glutamate and glycine-binding domain-containing protein n=1 Tax=Anopheles epiroticus TaxID=199890 RepID=A0A182PIN6_9DIPT
MFILSCWTLHNKNTPIAQKVWSYPITIARQTRPVGMYARQEASFVLMDASGYGEKFPTYLASYRLDTHECYIKSAKFVVLVDSATNRTQVTSFFRTLGVLNYVAIPLTTSPTVDNPIIQQRLYTGNPFTNELHLFDVSDHNASSSDRYYPDKLTNIHGYPLLAFGLYDFPYLFEMTGNRTAGLLMEFLHSLIVRKLNGTVRMVGDVHTPPLHGRTEFDLTFAYAEFRPHFMHDVSLKERGGYCVLCPFHTERDFLRHLLKPFSLEIWLVLGALLVGCRLLGHLFPHLFERNLLEQIFFTSATSHLQPFPTRVVSFSAVVLIFFLSEAYNAKIISLMSDSKYFDRPETVRELIESELKIAIPGVRATLLADSMPGKLVSEHRASALYRERGQHMFNEYCTVTYCYMAYLQTTVGQNLHGFKQYVLRDMVLEKLQTIQLAKHSPFHGAFAEYYERFFQSGMWLHRLEYMNRKLARDMKTLGNRLDSVVFHFDDLVCVWVLIVVGWVLSAVGFLAELLWACLEHKLGHLWQRSNRLFTVTKRNPS